MWLMGVDVGQVQAATLQECDLRGGFRLDFGRADAAREETRKKCGELWREAAGLGIDEGLYFTRRQNRLAIHEHDVATHT